MAKTFTVGGFQIEFREQDNADRVELGETWERITFTPKKANGTFKNLVSAQFPNWQVRASALNAGIQGVFDLPKNPKLHVYDPMNPNRKAGFEGWIHADLLGDEPIVHVQGMTIANTFVRNPETKLRVYGATWEWNRLFQVSNSLFEARQDTSFGKMANGELTQFPWGTLKHIHLADLASGTTLIVYPLVRRVTQTEKPWLDTSAQDKAKWLYATLASIEDKSVSLDDAKRQYFQNQLFFRISNQEYTRMEATGKLTPEVQASVQADAVTFVTGGTVVPSTVMVNVDGQQIPLNMVPAGNFIATFRNGTKGISTQTLQGRRVLAEWAQTHNGNMKLETYQR